jgi:hypothetical protein
MVQRLRAEGGWLPLAERYPTEYAELISTMPKNAALSALGKLERARSVTRRRARKELKGPLVLDDDDDDDDGDVDGDSDGDGDGSDEGTRGYGGRLSLDSDAFASAGAHGETSQPVRVGRSRAHMLRGPDHTCAGLDRTRRCPLSAPGLDPARRSPACAVAWLRVHMRAARARRCCRVPWGSVGTLGY